MDSDKAVTMALPQEILQLFCKYLDRSDLRSVRLASKALNDAAEIWLFRHIYLRRNTDSFCRLRKVSSSPHLAKLVKAITYSGKMLWEGRDTNTHPIFKDWCGLYLQQGLQALCKEDEDILCALVLEEKNPYYLKWREHLHKQMLMRRPGLEKELLEVAFRKLSQLEEICFGPGDIRLSSVVTSTAPKHFSSLGREMLVEPTHRPEYRVHHEQFTAMMAAAHKYQKEIKVIKALDLGWNTFEQGPEVLEMMIANMRCCEHFLVKILSHRRRANGDVGIGLMACHAPHLQTLELFLPGISCQRWQKGTELSRLFDPQVRWPHLKRLQLHGLSATEAQLKSLLLAHATSLQSLSLSCIVLKPFRSEGGIHHSSWVEMVLFLRESLYLHKMQFEHALTTEGCENWRIYEPTMEYDQGTPSVRGDLTFKSRVERYVEVGGEFPFPWPTKITELLWRDLLLDFRPKLDETWSFHESEPSDLHLVHDHPFANQSPLLPAHVTWPP